MLTYKIGNTGRFSWYFFESVLIRKDVNRLVGSRWKLAYNLLHDRLRTMYVVHAHSQRFLKVLV